jgi:hypothetical protein
MCRQAQKLGREISKPLSPVPKFAPYDIYLIDYIFVKERDCLVKGGRSPTGTKQSLSGLLLHLIFIP